jgi:hypothetical protein
MRERPADARPDAGLAALAWVSGAIFFFASCGARTGLEGETSVPLDAGLADATSGEPGPADVGGADAGDARDDGAGPVPYEASLPIVNPRSPPPLAFTTCPDPSAPSIYVVTQDGRQLFTFDPSTAAFRLVGTLRCPSADSPESMAVDRSGTAYVLYTDGSLFRVSTQTAQCSATSFMSAQAGFSRFGMSFASNASGTFETLYVAPQGGLATIDLVTFQLHLVGQNSLNLAELTGTGDGRLFAFSASSGASAIMQLDPSNGSIVATTDLPQLPLGDGFAFAFWASDFYLFTGSTTATGSQVTRFRPSDRSQVVVATLSSLIVGAGVSTCAPPM